MAFNRFVGRQGRALGRRFMALYLVLYPLPFPLTAIPGATLLQDAAGSVWQAIVPWFGRHALGQEVAFHASSSGDTAYHYVQTLLMLLIALAGGLLWLLLDRDRRREAWISTGSIIVCRYYLAMVMLTYGLLKVFKLQFPTPGLERLVQAYGESSPMGLASTFVGHATAYSVFIGSLEVVSGGLLLFRRTRLLGALATSGVMASVLVFNLCYDLPAKLLAANTFLFAVYLVALDGRRLIDLLILGRPTTGIALAPYVRSPRLRSGLRVAKLAVIGLFLFGTVGDCLASRKGYGDGRSKPLLYGIYEVELFEKDGRVVPPLLTDAERWRTVIIERHGAASVRFMDDRIVTLSFLHVGGTVKLASFDDVSRKEAWTVARPSPDRLVLAGDWQGSGLRVVMKRQDLASFPLLARGFNWVQERRFDPGGEAR